MGSTLVIPRNTPPQNPLPNHDQDQPKRPSSVIHAQSLHDEEVTGITVVLAITSNSKI